MSTTEAAAASQSHPHQTQATTSPSSTARAGRPRSIGNDPTANLWACLASGVNWLRAAQALTGVDASALLQLVAAEAVTADPVRHRLASIDDADSDFLRVIADAEPMLRAVPTWAFDDELLRSARQHVELARQTLDERSVSLVDAGPMMGLRPALSTVIGLVDMRTRQQHATFLAVLACAVEAGLVGQGAPHLSVGEDGELVCDELPTLSYRHPSGRGSDDATTGIRAGHIHLDVPDYSFQNRAAAWESMRRRTTSTTAIVTFDPSDVSTHRDEIVLALQGVGHW